ncbi:unnamed protein product, partial [Linum tenue]
RRVVESLWRGAIRLGPGDLTGNCSGVSEGQCHPQIASKIERASDVLLKDCGEEEALSQESLQGSSILQALSFCGVSYKVYNLEFTLKYHLS